MFRDKKNRHSMQVSFNSVRGRNCESDPVVILVEVGVVLSHEDVTEDEVVKTCREVGSHNGENTFGLAELRDFENVVVRREFIFDLINEEGDIGKSIQVAAVLVDAYAFNEFAHDVRRANKD